MITKTIKAKEVRKGDILVNVGPVEKAETAPLAHLTALTVTKGFCKSAAFYWYDSEQPLMIQREINAKYAQPSEISHTS